MAVGRCDRANTNPLHPDWFSLLRFRCAAQRSGCNFWGDGGKEADRKLQHHGRQQWRKHGERNKHRHIIHVSHIFLFIRDGSLVYRRVNLFTEVSLTHTSVCETCVYHDMEDTLWLLVAAQFQFILAITGYFSDCYSTVGLLYSRHLDIWQQEIAHVANSINNNCIQFRLSCFMDVVWFILAHWSCLQHWQATSWQYLPVVAGSGSEVAKHVGSSWETHLPVLLRDQGDVLRPVLLQAPAGTLWTQVRQRARKTAQSGCNIVNIADSHILEQTTEVLCYCVFFLTCWCLLFQSHSQPVQSHRAVSMELLKRDRQRRVCRA